MNKVLSIALVFFGVKLSASQDPGSWREWVHLRPSPPSPASRECNSLLLRLRQVTTPGKNLSIRDLSSKEEFKDQLTLLYQQKTIFPITFSSLLTSPDPIAFAEAFLNTTIFETVQQDHPLLTVEELTQRLINLRWNHMNLTLMELLQALSDSLIANHN